MHLLGRESHGEGLFWRLFPPSWYRSEFDSYVEKKFTWSILRFKAAQLPYSQKLNDTMTAYQSISVDEEETTAQNPRSSFSNTSRRRSNHHRIWFIAIAFAVLALVTTSLRALFRYNDDNEDKASPATTSSTIATSSATNFRRHINVPIPTGVNLGSWVRDYHLVHIRYFPFLYLLYYLLFLMHKALKSFNSCLSKIGSTLVTMEP